MQIFINGDSKTVDQGCTIAWLLDLLNVGRERVAVEVNMEIVPKTAYDSHVLTDGDKIEIVHFVGGG